jgi:Tol biopolymer transport system component
MRSDEGEKSSAERGGGDRRTKHMRRRCLAWVVLVLASCQGAPAEPTPSISNVGSTPSPSVEAAPAGPWIVFHSDPGGDSRLSLMRPDGSDLTLLTDTVAGYPFGAWSPDGSRVAFLSGSFGEGALLVINADGSGEAHVTDIQARAPDWSPDGTRLVFEAVDGGIYSVGADGSGLTELTLNGSGPRWSPDGSRITFFSNDTGNFDVYVMSSSGAGRERLTSDPADDVSPAWSPDGTRIAFVSERDGNADLYVVDPDDSHERRLTTSSAPDEAFAWAPGGDRIAYVSYRHGAEPENIGIGDAEVFVVDARTGETRNLSRNPAWDGDPDWSPDGRRIVFTRRTDHAEIYVMRADGSGQRMLAGFPGDAVNDCCALWQP